MNRQGTTGINWTHVFGPGSGKTWNPITGCLHHCQWNMGADILVQCYAKSVAEGVARQAYPQGFETHGWHPGRLDEPRRLTKPAGIFLDSMGDLFGAWVPDANIHAVLDIVRDCPQHVFFVLTKAAPRLLKFRAAFPPNLWVGVSAPPTYMGGKELTVNSQYVFLLRALDVLSEIGGVIRWISFEPLSFNASAVLHRWLSSNTWLPLEWAVIGAASNGKTLYQPDPAWVVELMALLDDHRVPVMMKDNLAWSPRREEYPPLRSATQISLFEGNDQRDQTDL